MLPQVSEVRDDVGRYVANSEAGIFRGTALDPHEERDLSEWPGRGPRGCVGNSAFLRLYGKSRLKCSISERAVAEQQSLPLSSLVWN